MKLKDLSSKVEAAHKAALDQAEVSIPLNHLKDILAEHEAVQEMAALVPQLQGQLSSANAQNDTLQSAMSGTQHELDNHKSALTEAANKIVNLTKERDFLVAEREALKANAPSSKEVEGLKKRIAKLQALLGADENDAVPVPEPAETVED